MQYKGYLYGHYDSRGGTTFVVAKARAEADYRYLKDVYGFDDNDIKEFAHSAIDEDFLCQATLLSHDEIELNEGSSSFDLEADGTTKIFILTGNKRWTPDTPDHEFLGDLLDGKKHALLLYRPDGSAPKLPAVHPRWDDDAFAFNFLPPARVVV